MDIIELIRGDSSDIYEFSSKQIKTLDSTWEGSWVVSEELGSTPIIKGDLIKNVDIFNDDSLETEDYRKSYKIFEGTESESLEFYEDSVTDSILTVSGKIFNNIDNSAIPNKYAYIKVKGIFVDSQREIRVKTDENGEFTGTIDLKVTIKTPADSFFIFQIMPTLSEELLNDSYILAVEIRQKDSDDNIVFRKEILRSKLKVIQEGLLKEETIEDPNA